MSYYFHVGDLSKSVGFKDGDNLFYGIPGRSLEASINLLRDDASVYEMMKLADQSNFLEVYIQNKDHDTGSNPTAGTTVHHANATKVFLSYTVTSFFFLQNHVLF